MLKSYKKILFWNWTEIRWFQIIIQFSAWSYSISINKFHFYMHQIKLNMIYKKSNFCFETKQSSISIIFRLIWKEIKIFIYVFFIINDLNQYHIYFQWDQSFSLIFWWNIKICGSKHAVSVHNKEVYLFRYSLRTKFIDHEFDSF